MDSERWQTLKHLFTAVLELPPEERSRFLDQKCADDPDLRHEIEQLLEAHANAGEFLEHSTVSMRGLIEQILETESYVGRHIGSYRIERVIGRGGMGVVYAATRDDQEFKKRVALKIVKRGMDTDEILRRFRHERQTLAGLNHPYIARLYDGGTTESGLPYFVMEFVEGIPIDQYCDVHRMTIEERLHLFCKVCEAVHYAHQNLIIHRDIKPANILVTASGDPKLVDFGIAKLINPELSNSSVYLTREFIHLMTPEYASPEQIRGLPIATSSDVYSLGVLLYELLTGVQPYRFETRTPHEIERVICDEEPVRPSQAFGHLSASANGEEMPESADIREIAYRRKETPHRLRKRLRGDLDTITMMALRKEPHRRYASAEQLAADIRRHLNGLPVIAQKDTFWYRAQKFTQRHKKGVVAGVAMVLLLLASTIAVLWQARIAAQQHERARVQARKAEKINEFLQEMLTAANPLESGKDISVRALLDRAAEKARRQLAYEPEILAAVYSTIGSAYTNLGQYDKADWVLRESIHLAEQSVGAGQELANALSKLATLRLRQGRYADAKELFEKSLNMLQESRNAHTLTYARVLNDFAVLLNEIEQYQKAEAALLEVLSMKKTLLGPTHPGLIEPYSTLGSALMNMGRIEEAGSRYRQALQLARAHDDPKQGVLLNNLGTLRLNQGRYEAADSLLKQSLEQLKSLLGQQHPYVAIVLMNLVATDYHLGRYEMAQTYISQARRIYRSRYSGDHPDLIHLAMWEGRILNQIHRPREAEQVLRQGIRMGQRLLAPESWLITYCQVDLGHSLLLQGRHAEAGRILQTSYQRLLKTPGDNRSAIKRTLQFLIQTQEALGRTETLDSLRALLQKQENH